MPSKTIVPRSAGPVTKARQIARDTAEEFFAELALDIPFIEDPERFIEAGCEIRDLILEDVPAARCIDDPREDAALRAGYLLGVEIGRRLAGGAR